MSSTLSRWGQAGSTGCTELAQPQLAAADRFRDGFQAAQLQPSDEGGGGAGNAGDKVHAAYCSAGVG
jgi:hypothetical protein